MRKIYLVLLLSVWHSWIMADAAEQAPEFFNQLYINTCLKNSADMQALKQRFEAIDTKQLPRDKASFFLGNSPGTVWEIPNVYGDFLVSIDHNNQCVVYTHHVSINAIERKFIKLLEKTPSSFKLERVQDETLQTTLGPAHVIRFIRTNKADSSTQQFILQTTNAPAAQIHVKAIVEPIVFAPD